MNSQNPNPNPNPNQEDKCRRVDVFGPHYRITITAKGSGYIDDVQTHIEYSVVSGLVPGAEEVIDFIKEFAGMFPGARGLPLSVTTAIVK